MGELYDEVCNIDNLWESAHKTLATSKWKTSTINFNDNKLIYLASLSDELENETYVPSKPSKFILNERGTLRVIKAPVVRDRIVQANLTNKVLAPIVRRKLIYDNSASLVDRGVSHFRNRLLLHLRRFLARNRGKGYVVKGDFTKFFDNIEHERLMDMYDKIIPDDKVLRLIQTYLDQDVVDVSYLSDEEYAHCMEVPYNAHATLFIDKSKLTGEKLMKKSIGIGNPVSQISGALYPHVLDDYCKIVRGIKEYARYCDDFYALVPTLDDAHQLLNEIDDLCRSNGLFLNKRKTQIINLKHEFTILKLRYVIFNDGDIAIIPDKNSYRRIKRKFRGQLKNVIEETLTIDDVENGYLSWRGNMAKYCNKRSLEEVDNRYIQYFQEFIDMRDSMQFDNDRIGDLVRIVNKNSSLPWVKRVEK